jgi:PAS domain S-box-containing protein
MTTARLNHEVMVENLLEGCQIIDRDFRYLYVNKAAARHGRKPRAELIGRRMHEVYPGIETTSMFASLKQCMEKGTAARLENAFAYGDGSAAWFELSIEPVPEGVFVLSIDVSDSKRVEQALRRSEERLSITLQSLGDGVIATDAAGIIDLMNPAAERMCGRTAREAVGLPLEQVFRVVNAETRQPLQNPVQRVLELRGTVGLADQTTLLASDGSELQIADSAAPMRDSTGQVMGVVLVFRDVTQAYRAQQELRGRERQLTIITDALPGPVTRTDREGRYVFANTAFARAVGRTIPQILGRTRVDILGPENCAELEPLVQRALAGETLTFESPLETADDGRRRMLLTLLPERDDRGEVCGLVSVATDITGQKLDEEKILAQLEELLRWQDVMLNRESRVQELKDEVNALLIKAGHAPRYGPEARR